MPKLLSLSGYAQVGKDSVGNYLVENYGYTRVSFADALRDALYALNPQIEVGTDDYGPLQDIIDTEGWDTAKIKYSMIRELLQRMGTEVGRSIFGDNIWVDIAMKKVDAIDGPVVITDCRFHNELIAILQKGGNAIRIYRAGVSPVNLHPSETALDRVAFKTSIHNNSTLEDLYRSVDTLLSLGQ